MKLNLDTSKTVESRIPMKPNPNTFSLALGILTNVEVRKAIPETKEDEVSEFKGKEIPRIYFEFQNIKTSNGSMDDVDRFYTLNYGIVALSTNKGEAIEKKTIEELWQNQFDCMLHIYNSFKVGQMPKVIEFDPFASIDTRIKQVTAFYESIADSFNKGRNKKEVYKDEKGNYINLWLKLIADYKSAKRHAFPTFVKQGFIEMVRYAKDGVTPVAPILEIKPDESIILRSKDDAAPTPITGARKPGTGTNTSPSVADIIARAKEQAES